MVFHLPSVVVFFTMGRLNRLEELLGEELVVEHGEREIVRTMEALQGEGLVVGLYFDAYFSSENRGVCHFLFLGTACEDLVISCVSVCVYTFSAIFF